MRCVLCGAGQNGPSDACWSCGVILWLVHDRDGGIFHGPFTSWDAAHEWIIETDPNGERNLAPERLHRA